MRLWRAGIQRLRYEETGKIDYDFDHWIPAKAGMAVSDAGMTVKCQRGLIR